MTTSPVFRPPLPRALLVTALSAAMLTPTLPATVAAQPVDGGVVRRVKYTLVGALVGSALTTAYYFAADPEDRSDGCKPWSCVLPYLAGSGAVTGLFLSREIAMQRAALAPRLAPRERARIAEVALAGSMARVQIADSLVYVVGDSGVQVIGMLPEPRALRRRATGLRGLRDVALQRGASAGGDRLLIAGEAALYATPPVSGAVSRVLGGDVVGIASGTRGWLAIRGTAVVAGRAAGDGITVTDSMALPRAARAIAYDSVTAGYWVATDSALTEFTLSPEGRLARARQLSVAAPVLGVAVSAEHIAVSTEAQSLLIWTRSELANAVIQPARVELGSAYPYDVTFRGEELFVAAGAEGLFRVALTPRVEVLATITDVRFATSVRAAANGDLWVADRARGAVVRVTVPPRPVYR